MELNQWRGGGAGALKEGMESSSTKKPIFSVKAQFTPAWKMVGLRGQTVGAVSSVEIDLYSGRILEVELATPWQTMEIPWQRVAVDAEKSCFKLLPR
ncbi:MAG: hypothetical protein Hals2KO_29070 [Halioglobus sp.]